MGETCSTYGDIRKAYKTLFGKTKRDHLKDVGVYWTIGPNVKVHLQELSCEYVNWIPPTQETQKRRDIVNAIS
jgi:hypothetical protein